MLFVEAGREPKVRELQMAVDIEKDVIGFDVTALISKVLSFLIRKSKKEGLERTTSTQAKRREGQETSSYIRMMVSQCTVDGVQI